MNDLAGLCSRRSSDCVLQNTELCSRDTPSKRLRNQHQDWFRLRVKAGLFAPPYLIPGKP